jgi:FkbM family methyltransferase
MLPPPSKVFPRLVRIGAFTANVCKHLGALEGLRAILHWRLGRGVRQLRFGKLPCPVLLRAGTSDLPMFVQTFLDRQYEFELPLAPRTIVDAGANIGMASLYFTLKYPGARILALEPDPSNFRLLKENCAQFPNIVAIHAALWRSSGTLNLITDGRAKSEVEVSEEPATSGSAAGVQVPCVSMPDLMREHQLAHLDLLKLDIEGSEKAVLDASGSWIGRVEVLIVELHENLAPNCTRSFQSATAGFGEITAHGENVVATRRGQEGSSRPPSTPTSSGTPLAPA